MSGLECERIQNPLCGREDKLGRYAQLEFSAANGLTTVSYAEFRKAYRLSGKQLAWTASWANGNPLFRILGCRLERSCRALERIVVEKPGRGLQRRIERGAILAGPVKQICKLVALIAILGSAFCVGAEEPQILKTWSFQGAEGTVNMQLTQTVGSDGKTATVLHIYSPDGAPRSVAKEAGFLSKVLDDLPKAGIGHQALDWISFRFNESKAVSKVATYAASSKRWRESVKTKNMSVVYPLVTSFLNASGAYEEWDRVFKQHGLTLKVAGVEEVIMEPFSKARASCPIGTDCTNLLVPKDALVQMNVDPITHP